MFTILPALQAYLRNGFYLCIGSQPLQRVQLLQLVQHFATNPNFQCSTNPQQNAQVMSNNIQNCNNVLWIYRNMILVEKSCCFEVHFDWSMKTMYFLPNFMLIVHLTADSACYLALVMQANLQRTQRDRLFWWILIRKPFIFLNHQVQHNILISFVCLAYFWGPGIQFT